MTIEEKLLQLTQMPSAYIVQDGGEVTGPAWDFGLTNNDVSRLGTILNARQEDKINQVHDDFNMKNGSKVPMAIIADVTHGFKTGYPVHLGLSCSFDGELVKDCTAMAAKESAIVGVSMTCSTMLDLVRDARWGRVVESFGEDPYLGEVMAKASVEGFQGDFGKYNVAACPKHFVGYGASIAGRDYNTVDMNEYTLRNFYLPPFKSAVDAGAELLMPAFNLLDGQPMIVNKKLMVDILRDEWGFDGVTVSDYNAFPEAITHGVCEDEKAVALNALKCKVDIEMSTPIYFNNLKELLAEGKVTIEDIDESVLRILRLKNKLGLFENPRYSQSKKEQDEIFLCPEHRALALKAAEESAVLLKNDGVLPIFKDIKTIALIGPHSKTNNIIGPWGAECLPEDAISVMQGVKNLYNGKILQEDGCAWDLDAVDESGIKKAVKIAKRADTVILCLGEAPTDSGEGTSKLNIDLPEIQYKLFNEVYKANKNLIVVLFTGRPLAIKRLADKAPAILNIWWPGTEGGNAVARLLFGEKSPCGKLSMTFPVTVGQCPIYYNHENTGRPRSDDTKRIPFSSSYIDGPNKPLYPFGYGLSYTNFEYSKIELSQDKFTTGENILASVTVKNTGKYTAKEVVQLYIKDEFGSIARPVRELKGFEKIELKPNEEKTVSFVIDEKMLAYYGVERKFCAEKGKFVAYIGGDSTTDNGTKFELV